MDIENISEVKKTWLSLPIIATITRLLCRELTLQNDGTAHGAMAMTTPGDATMATLKEVEKLIKGDGARVDR